MLNQPESQSVTVTPGDFPVQPWHLRARIIVGVATFFDAFDALAIAYVLPLLTKQWALSSTQIGITIALGYVGQVIGALLAGFLADRYGRLRVLMLTVAILSLCSFLMAFSWSWTSLLVIRMIQGVGLGVSRALPVPAPCPESRIQRGDSGRARRMNRQRAADSPPMTKSQRQPHRGTIQ